MKALREGFTTGSCAAACALASCLWQRDGFCPDQVLITLPEGRSWRAQILARSPFCCGVIKDSGDDPDITNGCEVRAEASLGEGDGPVTFRAGEGVGTITLPGLKLPVGEPAINPVPRRMIEEAVRSVYPTRALEVTVSIPGGQALAERTFNPRLGIVGGLSVLGTSGVVRPMSEDALQETIRLELSMRRAQGAEEIALAFGMQGENALRQLLPGLPCVQISNFVGFALDACAELGFARAVLAGQPGKLCKVSGGCMQTHSRYGDGRRENVAAHLALLGADRALIGRVMSAVTLEGVIGPIREAGYERVWGSLARSAAAYCAARVRGKTAIRAIVLDGEGAVLGEGLAERKQG